MTSSFDAFITQHLQETVGLQAPSVAPQPTKPSVPQPPQQQTAGNPVEDEFLKLLQSGKVNPKTIELLMQALEKSKTAQPTQPAQPQANATNQPQTTPIQQNTVK